MFGHVKEKGIHFDPRTKLLLIVVIATLELMDINIYFTVAVGTIPCILFICNRQFLGAVKYYALFLLAAFIHVHRVDIQLNMFLNMFVVLLGALILKLSPAFACADYIIKSTGVSEMISAFSKMKVSRNFLIPLSVMFRFAPTIAQERHAIHDAAAMRGIIITRKKFWENPLRAFEYRIVPLMISIANIGEDLSAASLSRGLDKPGIHTNYTDVKFARNDYIAMALAIIFLTSVYLLSTFAG